MLSKFIIHEKISRATLKFPHRVALLGNYYKFQNPSSNPKNPSGSTKMLNPPEWGGITKIQIGTPQNSSANPENPSGTLPTETLMGPL